MDDSLYAVLKVQEIQMEGEAAPVGVVFFYM